jgi:hypothetical protein
MEFLNWFTMGIQMRLLIISIVAIIVLYDYLGLINIRASFNKQLQ